LARGLYDVVLFDYAREVARLPKALTIARVAGDAELEVEGAFKAPSDALVAELKPGDALLSSNEPIADVIAVGKPSAGEMRVRVGGDTVTVRAGERDLPATTSSSWCGAAGSGAPAQGSRRRSRRPGSIRGAAGSPARRRETAGERAAPRARALADSRRRRRLPLSRRAVHSVPALGRHRRHAPLALRRRLLSARLQARPL